MFRIAICDDDSSYLNSFTDGITLISLHKDMILCFWILICQGYPDLI